MRDHKCQSNFVFAQNIMRKKLKEGGVGKIEVKNMSP